MPCSATPSAAQHSISSNLNLRSRKRRRQQQHHQEERQQHDGEEDTEDPPLTCRFGYPMEATGRTELRFEKLRNGQNHQATTIDRTAGGC